MLYRLFYSSTGRAASRSFASESQGSPSEVVLSKAGVDSVEAFSGSRPTRGFSSSMAQELIKENTFNADKHDYELVVNYPAISKSYNVRRATGLLF